MYTIVETLQFYTLFSLVIGTFSALVGVVFCHKLTEPKMIFDWWPDLVTRIVGPVRKRPKLHKLLYGCEACIAGQLALWVYLMAHFKIAPWQVTFDYPYSFIAHIGAIFAAIYLAQIFTYIFKKCQTVHA